MLSMFLEQAADTTAVGGANIIFIVVEIVVIIAFFYFFLIRPQRNEQKKIEQLRNSVQPGDNIMTTGGFYGVVLDVVDDTVIVEFGNNKNCRIPMHRNAIAEVEREDTGEEIKDSKKK